MTVMRISTILMRKRSKKLWVFSRRKVNLCLFTITACLIFGYIIVMDVVQKHAHSLEKDVYIWRRVNASIRSVTVKTVSTILESTCKQRDHSLFNGRKTKVVGFLHNLSNKQSDQVCIHPQLDPCNPSVAGYDKSVNRVNCLTEEDWVYVQNGTFRISSSARLKYGTITCEYAPIVRGKGDYAARHAEHIKPMLDGRPLVSDFFKVACVSSSGKRYHNIHAGVAYDPAVHAKLNNTKLPKNALGYDVFMFGFDSTSRMSWIRNLPKTREFFLNVLGGIELEGYNIIGDGTVQALLPILTGNTEQDLPSARRDDPASSEVDHFPWIWKLFREAGYVTAWAEDMSHIGTFQMRLRGFKEQPTDHSMRTYFLMAESMFAKSQPWCVGSEPRHLRFLNWFRDLYHMYGNKPKFLFGFHSEYSHESNSELKKIDEDFTNLLKHLHSNGYLRRTILILMSDHGSRFAALRNTPQGKLEERLPYFAFSFPDKFMKSHPAAIANFKINTKRLTTPFDIHETFHDIIKFQRLQIDHTMRRGTSLFKEVPKSRTCASSGIEPHWCACLDWVNVDDSATTEEVSSAVLTFINNLTSHLRHVCAYLKLDTVTNLSRFSPNSQVLKYKKSLDRHGDKPDFTDNMTLDHDYYQISLVTEPGNGHFEVTVKHSTVTKELWVNENEISRTNLYKDAPSCIADTYPHLRPYCYCL